MMMVPAGRPVDDVIGALKPLIGKGDILIDGGNSYFMNTTARTNELKKSGIIFIGTGVSGREEGALRGSSIMPGGNYDGWPYVSSFLRQIAAKAEDGDPVVTGLVAKAPVIL